jgi:hypothetical protein
MTVNILKILEQLASSATSHFSKQMVSTPVKTDYNTQTKTLQVYPETTTPLPNLPRGSVCASHVPRTVYHGSQHAQLLSVVTYKFHNVLQHTAYTHTSTWYVHRGTITAV